MTYIYRRGEMKTILTVFDNKSKTCFKQFKTDGLQHSPAYNKTSKQAHKLQKNICKLFSIKNDGIRIGVHINLFEDIPKAKVLF